MSKKILISMLLFSLGLIAASLYIMTTLDVESKPKPMAKIINIISGNNGKIDDQFKLQSTDGKDLNSNPLMAKILLLLI